MVSRRPAHSPRVGGAGAGDTLIAPMKLIIQIPCLNEEATLPQTIAALPRTIAGIDEVELLVIDDGSTDRTVEVARECGVEHIVRLTNNKGLAAAFQAGLDACLKLGADVVVNTDADNQYSGADVPRLLAPILAGEADMVVGDRRVATIGHFSGRKKALQRAGSWVVRRLSGTEIADTTSGFRAYNREAALGLLVTDDFTYTLESLIQAGKMLVAVDQVEMATNPLTRHSRARSAECLTRLPAKSGGSEPESAPGDGSANADYGGLASLLAIGVGLTGLITYAYFLIASHVLSKPDYGQITVLWSAVFITISTLYRPVEQLLSRHISERLVKREPIGQPMRVAATIQLGLAAFFAAPALAPRRPIQDNLLEGNETLFWVFFGAVLFYAASYFARGFLAGQRSFGLFTALILSESVFRTLFAVLVAVSLLEGQSAVAVGIVAAPSLSLMVVPLAFLRRAQKERRVAPGTPRSET